VVVSTSGKLALAALALGLLVDSRVGRGDVPAHDLTTFRAAKKVRSGIQIGNNGHPEPLSALCLNGPQEGQKTLLYCLCGNNPTITVFAREVTDPLIELIRRLDGATSKHAKHRMYCFVVLLTEDKAKQQRLSDLARRENLRGVLLTARSAALHRVHRLAEEADVTVLLVNKRRVQANHAYQGMTSFDVDAILQDLPTILPWKN
jgi:hypothetical protein